MGGGSVAECIQSSDVACWDGDVNSMIGIVPFNSAEATIMCTSPVLTHRIKLLQCIHKVFISALGLLVYLMPKKSLTTRAKTR